MALGVVDMKELEAHFLHSALVHTISFHPCDSNRSTFSHALFEALISCLLQSEAAGKTMIGVRVDHIFLCIRDAGEFLKCLVLLLMYSDILGGADPSMCLHWLLGISQCWNVIFRNS